MFEKETVKNISIAAQLFGFDARHLLSIAWIESKGKVLIPIEGRYEPVIRFEGHYFDQRLRGKDRILAREKGLASPRAGKIPNPRTQKKRWELLRQAIAINYQAAMESVSWGMGQVMGAHWKLLGFKNINGLVSQARSGSGGQAALMANFIHKNQLLDALEKNDWERFALGYNGPNYKKNAYHIHLAETYKEFASQKTLQHGLIQKGHKGHAVSCLQWMLTNTGESVKIDGIFGLETEHHLCQFQKKTGLSSTGIADSKTLAYLRDQSTRDPYKNIPEIPSWLTGASSYHFEP